MYGRFRNLGGYRDIRFIYFYMLSERFFHGFNCVFCNIGLHVDQGKDNTGILQVRLHIGAYLFDRSYELGHTYGRQILRLHRDQDLIRSNDRIYGEYSQRRGTVDEDIIVIILDCLNTVCQDLLSHKNTGKPRFILRKTDVGGDKIYALIMMKDDVIEFHRFLPDRGFDNI